MADGTSDGIIVGGGYNGLMTETGKIGVVAKL